MRRILAAFRADVVQGILKRWYVYALAVLAAVLFALDSRIQLKPIMERPGTLDLLAFMLRGAEKYIPGLQQNRFELSYGKLTKIGQHSQTVRCPCVEGERKGISTVLWKEEYMVDQ